MIKCIIIDDDKIFTKILEHFISKVDFLTHSKTYHSSTIAFKELSDNEVDLVFLDMEIPEMHGLELLDALSTKPAVVFVSGSKNYGTDAFDYDALDYLHKPITISRFLKCSQKIYQHFNKKIIEVENDNDGIFIKDDGLWKKILLEEINIIKADNNHIIITTNKDKYRTNIKLKDIIEKLPKHDFIQVHRSYIVQLKKITKIDREVLEVNNKSIPISKTYLEILYKRLNLT